MGQLAVQVQELDVVGVAEEEGWPLRQRLRRRAETESRPQLVWDEAVAEVGPAGTVAVAGAAGVVGGRRVLSPQGGAGGEGVRWGRRRR